MRPTSLLLLGTCLVMMFMVTASKDTNSLSCTHRNLPSCLCKRKKNLVCQKANCMNRLPMNSNLTEEDGRHITTLQVIRQKDLNEISDDDFQNLVNLEVARLSRNSISRISVRAFQYQQKLRHLDLQRNKLTSVPRAILYLPNLRLLNLGRNMITTVSPDDFSRSGSLEVLILRNNQLQQFPTRLPQNIIKLSLVNNQITSVGDATMYSKLETLRLDYNKLTEIPNGNYNVSSNVQELTVCNNDLSDDSVNNPGALQGLSKLRRLCLSNNPRIRRITSDFLASDGAVALRELELGANSIEQISSDAFSCVPNLQFLGLKNNRLNAYDEKWVQSNRQLRRLELSGNPWSCTCNFVAYLNSLQKAVAQRIQWGIKRHPSSQGSLRVFKNDFNNITCENVDNELMVDVETEQQNNFTSYQNAKCLSAVRDWRFNARREDCQYGREGVPPPTESVDVVATTRKSLVPTTKKSWFKQTSRRTTTTRRPTTTTTTRRVTTTTRRPTTTTTTTTTTTEPSLDVETPARAKICTETGDECPEEFLNDGACVKGWWSSYCWIDATETDSYTCVPCPDE